MATRQVKTVTRTAPAARSNPIRKTAGKPKAAPAVLKLVTATSAPKPASMTGPLPPIVTLNRDAAGPEQFVADSAVEEDGFELSVPLTGYSGIFRKRMRHQRSSQKPSRPASKTSAIRVILRPVLTASSGSARAR
jgi:hypothetical protein